MKLSEILSAFDPAADPSLTIMAVLNPIFTLFLAIRTFLLFRANKPAEAFFSLSLLLFFCRWILARFASSGALTAQKREENKWVISFLSDDTVTVVTFILVIAAYFYMAWEDDIQPYLERRRLEAMALSGQLPKVPEAEVFYPKAEPKDAAELIIPVVKEGE